MIARPKTGSGCPICRAVDRMFSHTGLTPNAIAVGPTFLEREDLSTWCTKHRTWAAEAKREIEGTKTEDGG